MKSDILTYKYNYMKIDPEHCLIGRIIVAQRNEITEKNELSEKITAARQKLAHYARMREIDRSYPGLEDFYAGLDDYVDAQNAMKLRKEKRKKFMAAFLRYSSYANMVEFAEIFNADTTSA